MEQEARERGEEPPARPRRAEAGPSGSRRGPAAQTGGSGQDPDDFTQVVLENLKVAGVQNTKKGERLEFSELKPWPGRHVHAEGRYFEGETERRAAIMVGPEYGTVSRPAVRQAAREAADMFDILVVCGFAFDPHVGEDTINVGRLQILKARMNQDLHMADHLKKTGAANLFVVFGEPDIRIEDAGEGRIQVRIEGVDIFDPNTGTVKSSSTDDIACWFIDTDYDDESFFVRHAYFLGTKDPYEKLKRSLKAEIDEEAWQSLHSNVSRPFPKPDTGRIAVKVINHLGDEVMEVYDVE
jgi:adenine-specific DNA-methyltransferase